MNTTIYISNDLPTNYCLVQLLMLTATAPQLLSQRTGLMFLVDQNITVGKCPNDGAIFLGNGLSLPSAPKTPLLKNSD